MAEHLVGEGLVAIGPLANRVVLPPALLALAAGDGERHDHAIAGLELAITRTHLDHLAHEFVADDVARLHAHHEAVVEVEVGAANGAARHPDDRIARLLDDRIGHRIAADVVLAMPAEGLHAIAYLLLAPLDASVPLAPPDVPELEPPLGALASVELGALPAALEPYWRRQASRWSPTMFAHCPGTTTLLPAVLDALGAAALSEGHVPSIRAQPAPAQT